MERGVNPFTVALLAAAATLAALVAAGVILAAWR